jgi:hypothetical protein
MKTSRILIRSAFLVHADLASPSNPDLSDAWHAPDIAIAQATYFAFLVP